MTTHGHVQDHRTGQHDMIQTAQTDSHADALNSILTRLGLERQAMLGREKVATIVVLNAILDRIEAIEAKLKQEA